MKRIVTLSAVLSALTLADVSAQAPDRGAARGDRFARDDRDGDGRVTREEFTGPAQLFDRLDRNGDGVIMRAEVANREGAAGQKTRMPAVPDDVVICADVAYATNSPAQKLDILRPREAGQRPAPAIVFIHGGAFRAGDKRSAVGHLIPFVRKGYVCATINYRLSGEAVFPAQIHDCKCAIRFLRAHAADYGIDPARVGVWGSSAGGHLVAMLGTAGKVSELEGEGGWAEQSSEVQAVCDWFGPSDFVAMANQPSSMNHNDATSPEGQLIGGAVSDMPDAARRASPITYVSSNAPPFLIMHGTKDMTVPFGQSELLVAALRKAGVPVEFVPIEGGGHGTGGFNSPESRETVERFFDRYLRGNGAQGSTP